MTEFEETPNSTLLVEGKANVEIEGRAEVFGCSVERLRVPKGRIVPILILEKSLIRISGNYIRLNGSTIPESWEELAKSDFNSIFIFGDVDSGKSSLATFLVNRMDGSKDVFDFDIGQSDIAHPGAMGYAFTNNRVLHISQLQMHDGYFIGSISPAGRESLCLKAISKLKNLRRGDKAIFDSTGWVRGRKARDYKLAKLEILEPEVIACFGDIPYYLDDFNTIQVESFVVKRRSRELRCEIRGEIYREKLNDSFIRVFKAGEAGEVKLGNTSLFSGEEINLEGIIDSVVYAERGYDFLNVFTSTPQKPSPNVIKSLCEIFEVQEVNFVSIEELKGLLVGLYGDKYLGMGLLESIDFEKKEIAIVTRIGENIRRIDFGEIRLQKLEGHEGHEGFKEYFVRVP
jgi:polynucleotide 5'-hydroxyl-kinase GRC3/NOL9